MRCWFTVRGPFDGLVSARVTGRPAPEGARFRPAQRVKKAWRITAALRASTGSAEMGDAKKARRSIA